jgi:hypothetical protein
MSETRGKSKDKTKEKSTDKSGDKSGDKSKTKGRPDFALSKRLPMKFSHKASVQMSGELAFAACGNMVKVYSLKTAMQVK